jgi:pimeloyl-ACP methyl ester carboxylesterase
MPSGAPFLVEVFLEALALRPATRQQMQRLFESRFGATPDSYASLPGATRIVAPLLVVHDGEDDIVPHAHSVALLEQVAAAQLLSTTGLGHSALTRDAPTIATVADFLDRKS